MYLKNKNINVFLKNNYKISKKIKTIKKDMYPLNYISKNNRSNYFKFIVKKFIYKNYTGATKTFLKKTTKNKKKIYLLKKKYTGESKLTFKYNYFFTNFFTKFFKKSFFFVNFNYFLKVKIKKFKKLVDKLFYKNNFLKKTVYIYKILKIMLASIIYKDTKPVVFIIKEMFQAVHYSKHRIYFIFWRNLIKAFLSKYYKKLNIYGIRLEFHGKLGVGGNSKKRSVYYSMGRCSNSTKFFKMDSSNSFFRTETGVVGFTYSIFY